MYLTNLVYLIIALPRKIKKFIVLLLDVIICFMVTWISFSIRFDELYGFSEPVFIVTLISIAIAIPFYIIFGLYKAVFRFSSWHSSVALIKANVIYAFIFGGIILMFSVENVPRSIAIIQPIILFLATALERFMIKIILHYSIFSMDKPSQGSSILIYGAGESGRQLASGLRQGNNIKAIGFIDDNSKYWNSTINGLPVYGPSDISELLQSGLNISCILLAIPSATRSRQREILSHLSSLPIQVKVFPGLSNIVGGRVRFQDIRDVKIEDVLCREAVSANPELLAKNVKGKIVLVTGAGGSIGSELCRQIIRLNPKLLIAFELNEYALYKLDREISIIREERTKFIPILGSVLDHSMLLNIHKHYSIQTVYHAAAYKHVPMIELNPAIGILNNVFGTKNCVDAACQTGVETFVLVSTDKAVRPTNVMGCSKRLAELVLQAQNQLMVINDTHNIKLTMVRFGNVLGSSGSVVPIFKEQIDCGGPVTVTHPDVIRYFMTIPEAAELVIQAGAIGNGGDVMVLDMGEPVKILDLAARMIHLSGYTIKDKLNEDGDIEIIFTGLRPGEKLYEELLINDNAFPTIHPRISSAVEDSISHDELALILNALSKAIYEDDHSSIYSILKKAVHDFNHNGSMQ